MNTSSNTPSDDPAKQGSAKQRFSDEELFNPASGDKLGPYPASVDVPALEGRRYIWTARAFAISFFLSLVLNIMLVAAIFNLSPLKRVEPMLVTFKDKGEQIVRIEPFERGTEGFNLMTEKLASEYVVAREEILLNREIMQHRWGRLVRFRSTNNIYNEFVSQKQPVLTEYQSRSLSRRVNITSVNKFGQRSLRVEFTATDLNSQDTPIRTQEFEVIMEVAYLPQSVTFADRYVNPLGFTVGSYSLAQKENTPESTGE